MSEKPFKLSPSDFGFLWEECRRCFWLKVAKGQDKPPPPFPKIFNVIDQAMKETLQHMPSADWAPGAPKGTFYKADGWVQSVPMGLPGKTASFFIRGIFDTVLKLDDGGYAVVDFKTSTIGPDNAKKYARQLMAYAWALEGPAPGELAISPIRELGLLVYEPRTFEMNGQPGAKLAGPVAWLPVKRDDAAFEKFLDDVLDVLSSETAPPSGAGCKTCAYRAAARKMEW